MRILHKDLKAGLLKLRIEAADDLWYLRAILEPGDLVQSRVERKLKVGEKEVAVKRTAIVTIELEKLDFAMFGHELRLNGPVLESSLPEIAKGVYQTIDVRPGDIVGITKRRIWAWQLARLEEATKAVPLNILIVVHDREQALFALLKRYGWQLLGSLEGELPKKGAPADRPSPEDFFEQIAAELGRLVRLHSIKRVVLASPAFWREELLKRIRDAGLKQKIITASCSTVGPEAIGEVLRRPEIAAALREARIAEELRAVEQLLVEIGKDGLAAYGLEEVERAVGARNIASLLVSTKFIEAARERELFERVDALISATVAARAVLLIVDSGHPGGTKLDGLGGIAAILRYKSYG